MRLRKSESFSDRRVFRLQGAEQEVPVWARAHGGPSVLSEFVSSLGPKVRNEIAVLKRVSMGHKNIVSLHDFFETTHNLYVSLELDGLLS